MSPRTSALGKRSALPSIPLAAMQEAIICRASSESMMEKFAGYPRSPALLRRIRWPRWWKVPPQSRSVGTLVISLTRESIVRAALFVKVARTIRSGGTPVSINRATRCVSVLVFPLPAPAITSSGPPGSMTTRSCSGFSSRP